MQAELAIAYAVLSRLAYVGLVGLALRRQDRDEWYTRRWGVADGFKRFRRMAAVVMANDVVAFIVACIATRGTLALPVPRTAQIAVGVVLIVVGIGVKVWATAAIGGNAYYWHNFFAPPTGPPPKPGGPYRVLSNPMYTVGYLQSYGFALVMASLPGLILGVFAQAAIGAFYRLVERPHLQRLRARS